MKLLKAQSRELKRFKVIIIHIIFLTWMFVLNSNTFAREHMTSIIYNFDAELK